MEQECEAIAQENTCDNLISIETIHNEALKSKSTGKEPDQLKLASPRSLKACKKLGILPFQLVPVPLRKIIEQCSSKEIAKTKHEYQENKRLELIKQVMATKATLHICSTCESQIRKDPDQFSIDLQLDSKKNKSSNNMLRNFLWINSAQSKQK